MSRTPATAALERAGVPHSLHTYRHDPAAVAGGVGYGEEAAAALGVPSSSVFKTLVATVDAELVVAVLPVPARLDLKALAAAVGGKRAELTEPAVAQRATGYVVGGISPFGQRRRLRTVLDSSAAELERVYVSGGRRGLDIALAPSDLVTTLGALTAVITANLSRR